MLELEVGDDGTGFDPAHARPSTAHAVGLASMRERAEMLGGTFEIRSAPGSGTRVLATVLLEPPQARGEEAQDAVLASAPR